MIRGFTVARRHFDDEFRRRRVEREKWLGEDNPLERRVTYGAHHTDGINVGPTRSSRTGRIGQVAVFLVRGW